MFGAGCGGDARWRRVGGGESSSSVLRRSEYVDGGRFRELRFSDGRRAKVD